MPAISNTPRPGYAYDSTDDVWYPIGTGPHTHDYAATGHLHDSTYINQSTITTKGDLIVGTGSGTYIRQGVGANGTVLTANSAQADGVEWVAPVSGSMTLLSTTTLSGATTTISGISGAYKDLVAIIYGVTNATGNGNFVCSPNGSSSISTWVGWVQNNNSNSSGNYIDLSLNYIPERSVATNAWQFTIFNYASTTTRKPINFNGLWVNQFAPSGAPRAGFGGGGIDTTSAITSLVFSNTGGNLSSGTVLLYGVN